MKKTMYKSNIKQAVSNWNKKNPTLRKKTLGSVSKDIGKSISSLSLIDKNNYANQFQKHCEVIFLSESKQKQKETFELFKKANITIINTLSKVCDNLECEIYDIIKKI